jgi:RNA polymerase sigma-70 factor (ECF subfamily)
VSDRATLNDLMSAAADGDRAAIDPLFTQLWPIVASYATRYLGDRALAEDVAQDALVKLFGQLDRYDRERDALTWALTHATWQCRSSKRQQDRRREAPEPGEQSTAHDGRATLEQRELVRSALETLASLNAPDREALVAMLTDDDELRRALAPATFRKRLERALVRLRMSWRSRHGTL